MFLKLIFIYYCIINSGVKAVNKTDDAKAENKSKRIQDNFAVNILNATLLNSRNTIVSTLSLQLAFCKLASVARGAAKEELMQAMGFTNDEMISMFFANVREMVEMLEHADLTHVNKMYLDYKSNINSSFSENSTVQYGVRVDKVSYLYPTAASTFINRAVATATYRRIEGIMQPNDINNISSIMLVYAAHFKPSWEMHFDYSYTKKRKFYGHDKTVKEVPMLSKMDEYLVYDNHDYKILSTRLRSWGATMTFVMPTFVTIDAFLNRLLYNPGFLNKAKKLMKWQHVRLIMPAIRMKCQHDLIGVLRQIGLKEILDRNSTGLNAILNEGARESNFYVSKVKQKLFLQMDEFGVFKVNKELDEFTPMPLQPPGTQEFLLDHPYYFSVNVEVPGTESYELFSGVFYKPE